MPRWITFDRYTAEELRSRLPGEAHIEERGGDVLLAALETDLPSMAILPGDGSGDVVVMQALRRERQTAPPSRDPNRPVAYEATGFLGLHDEPIYEEDAKPRSWWRRLWE